MITASRYSYPYCQLVGIITSMKTAEPREPLDDTFSYREAREAGMSDVRIYGPRDAGAIQALGGGVYRWANAPPADFVAERVSRATLCLETALARHQLIDSIPAAIDVAIPVGAAHSSGAPIASRSRDHSAVRRSCSARRSSSASTDESGIFQ
jgi:hypothetical protein